MSKILPIVKEPHKVLRGKASNVLVSDITHVRIQRLIAHMKDTLQSTSDGVGLAAPQVGEPLRIFIVSGEAEEMDKKIEKEKKSSEIELASEEKKERPVWNYYVFINPVVKKMSREKLDGVEGCLSVPGRFGSIKRLAKITVEAHDEHGKKFTRGASRFFARVMQHELDHLDGTLFIDKARDFFDVSHE